MVGLSVCLSVTNCVLEREAMWLCLIFYILCNIKQWHRQAGRHPGGRDYVLLRLLFLYRGLPSVESSVPLGWSKESYPSIVLFICKDICSPISAHHHILCSCLNRHASLSLSLSLCHCEWSENTVNGVVEKTPSEICVGQRRPSHGSRVLCAGAYVEHPTGWCMGTTLTSVCVSV